MSGHSKWSTIKRKKAKEDAKRGKIYTKLIKQIVIAAKEGGGDIESNPTLRTAVQTARDNNMPKKNITKAIKRGTGELPGVNYERCSFEGYAPGGVAVYVNCLTDNHNRTSAEVRHIFNKYNGHLGEPHSVSYLFERKGQIVFEESQLDEETVYEIALENGAEDISIDGGYYELLSAPENFEGLHNQIVKAGIECDTAEIALIPNSEVKLNAPDAVTVLKLLDALEDHDDVENVSSNFDIPEDILNEIQDEI